MELNTDTFLHRVHLLNKIKRGNKYVVLLRTNLFIALFPWLAISFKICIILAENSRDIKNFSKISKISEKIQQQFSHGTVTSIATVLLPASDKHVHDLSGRNVYNPNICESKIRK